jgi:hypothetical protein
MDDTVGNETYSLNEAILHVNLTGKTGVTLMLDHWSLSDESNALPGSFVGHYKGDGIALSVDGQNWVKVTDLTVDFTNQSFSLDTILQQAKVAAGSSDISDVRIKFQQYDNYPALDDGREFDNIKIKLVSAVPEIEVLGNGQIIADGDTTPSAVDHTDFGSVGVGGSVVRTFTIRNTGTAVLNLTGVPKVQWTGSPDFSVVQQPISPVAAGGGTTTFQIQFIPSGPGLKTATVLVSNDDSDENPYDFVIQGTAYVASVDNVALGKAASQSSTWGPDIAVAGRAVDGNTSGDWWADESIASTKLQTHPWWQVDLGEVYSEITGIEIWNRTDSVPERLDDFYVFVSDVPFVSGDLAATLAQSGVWSYHHVGVPDPKVMLPVGRSGRYVRIQLADTNYLSLAEVKVFATA